MRFQEALAFLDSLVNYERQARPRTRFKLNRIRRLLRLAGNPEERLQRTILVAGTKGKGSVCYLLDAALRGCGLRTGLFISPHVASVRERIQLSGRPVSKQLFSRTVARLLPLVRRQPVSYFELTCAMAFDIFARYRPDYSIVEVGLGGSLDATNLANPMISVITRIGLDHVQVLGGTVRKIAREKAGIMRPARPVVIAPQTSQAASELARQAQRVKAEPVWVTEKSRVWAEEFLAEGIAFSCFTDLGAARIELPILGRHQIDNCLTALVLLGRLAQTDSRINLEAVRNGLSKVVIPARCQILQRQPLILLDACHNPDSGEALALVIRDHIRQKVVLLYGSLSGKLVFQTIRPLIPWLEKAVVTEPDSPRAMPVQKLARTFSRLGIRPRQTANVAEALAIARELSHNSLPIVIAGSFYVAGEALNIFRPGL
ncbi:MAG: folylpolyglutamate synthase/dihydrofolate synthase family protein [candidate division WOR-3 bacterium]